MAIVECTQNSTAEKTQGYAPIHGLSLYYEIQGTGRPLVYLPTGFGVAGTIKFPALAHGRRLITFDHQGRGRTADTDRPLTFEQQADDTVALLKYLGIDRADFLGECMGGLVALLIATRHPGVVRRVATYGAALGKFQDVVQPDILASARTLTPDSDVLRFQRELYQRVAPDPSHWPAIWSKVNGIPWSGFDREDLRRIQVPVLIAVGDHDWIRFDHVFETFQLIPAAQLAIIPDAGHFALAAEQEKVLPVIVEFLDAPLRKLPFATTSVPYHPGVAR